ncbi:MAG: 4'-phosphopantetheinyl transferase superfamily protein [Mucilaginibacter sp.]|uniref:4'-phosphopantetheinyl transferase family protein n=1 Tax=Mucilaginibacter sp. TaxID=1882438 RepID=UPI0034E3B12F
MMPSEIHINHLPGLTWQTTAFESSLNPEKADIWRIKITDFIPYLAILQPLLLPQEIEKVFRYKQESDQHRSLIGKAVLRILLSNYLNVDPKAVQFKSAKNKKPELENNFGRNLHFNISHSGNWVLIAIAATEVGIDVEEMNASFTYQNLLSFSFNLQEIDFIEKSDLPYQTFYQLWTRKESLLKATGKGLVDELSLVPSLTGVHQNPTEIIGSAESWQVLSFPVDENYVGSVAFMPVKTVLAFFDFKL